MLPFLDLTEPMSAELPSLRPSFLRSISQKHVHVRQEFLANELLPASFERRRPHAHDRSKDSFSYDYLTNGLRTKDRYKHFLWPLYDFQDGLHGFSPSRGITRAYSLKNEVREGVERVYGDCRAADETWVGANGEQLAATPDNGVPGELGEDLYLPPVIRMTTSSVDRALDRVTRWAEDILSPHHPLSERKPSGMSLGEARQLLLVVRKYVQAFDGLPNTHTVQSHGRLGPTTGTRAHVISLPSTVRRLLFEGSGLLDYDLRRCFWSIFICLGQALGFPTEAARRYTRNRSGIHAHWSCITGHSNPDDFKRVANSLLSGASLASFGETENAKLIGTDAMERLSADREAQDLYSEVREGHEALVREWGGKKTVRNAVGCVRRLPKGAGRTGKIANHLLTGFEQFAIRSICTEVEGLQAIVYDGFIAPPQDVESLERHLREHSEKALGIPLDLGLKATNISKPLPAPEATWEDLADF